MRDKLSGTRLSLGAGADAKRRLPADASCARAGVARMGIGAAHGRHQPVAIEGPGLGIGDRLAVTHHHDAIADVENLAQEMRDENASDATGNRPPREVEQLPRAMGIERRCRLIQDDQPDRLIGHRKGTRDFHHLASPDGKVLNQIGRTDSMPREDRVELVDDQPTSLATPIEARQARMKDARVLRDRQIGTKREFLEDAANPQPLGLSGRIASLLLTGKDHAPAIGNRGPRQDMHQRRFAGPVVADKPEALALPDHQVDAVDCADGAEMLFDAVQLDEFRARNDHSRPQIMTATRGCISTSHHFMLALMAAIASCWVYSWLATPPLVMLGSSASKSACVKAR